MFILKKVVSLALEPFLLGLLVLLAGLIVLWTRPARRGGRLLATAGAAVLVIFGLGPVAYVLSEPLEDRYPVVTVTEDLRAVRYVAVLGAGHVDNPALPAVQQLNASALGRLTEGVRLQQRLDSATLIVSGFEGRQVTPHATVAREAAISLGVPRERIIHLPRPRDTAEELAAIAEVVGDRRVLLVTSALHLPRAMDAARRRGLDATPAPAFFRARGRPRGAEWLVPDPESLALSAAAVHEYIGLLWYAVSDR